MRRVLVPHRMISCECRTSVGSMPRPLPTVDAKPALATAPHSEPVGIVDPRRVKKRTASEPLARTDWFPADHQGRTVSGPCRSIAAAVRSATTDRASSHVARSNSRVALRADAKEWVEDAIGAVDAGEEAVDLRTELAPRVRVLGVAAQPGGSTVVTDGDDPATGVRTVVVTRAENLVRHAPRLTAQRVGTSAPPSHVDTAAARRLRLLSCVGAGGGPRWLVF